MPISDEEFDWIFDEAMKSLFEDGTSVEEVEKPFLDEQQAVDELAQELCKKYLND